MSSFTPQNWELGPKWIPWPIGEIERRHYRKGKPPFDQAIGLTSCGTDEQWADGSTVNDSIPPDYPNSTIPQCCPPPIEDFTGGLALGVASFLDPCFGCVTLPKILFLSYNTPYSFLSIFNGLVIPLYENHVTCGPVVRGEQLYLGGPVSVGGTTYFFSVRCPDGTLIKFLEVVTPDCVTGHLYQEYGLLLQRCHPFLATELDTFAPTWTMFE